MRIGSCWWPAVLSVLAFTCADAAGPPDDISGACERQRECAAKYGDDGISYDEGECSDRLSAEYEDASGYGCGAVYADWVSCQANQRGNCPPATSANDESVDPCQGASDAFLLCQGKAQRDECGQDSLETSARSACQ